MTATERFVAEQTRKRARAAQLQADVDKLLALSKREFDLRGELHRMKAEIETLANGAIFNYQGLTSDGKYFVSVSDGSVDYWEVHTPEDWCDANADHDVDEPAPPAAAPDAGPGVQS